MATRPATEPRSTLHAFRDALDARSDDATVRIRDLGPLTQVGLRADAADAERLADAVGVALPARPNTVARGDGSRRALWLGPDEWLLVDEPGGGDALVAGAEEAAGVRWATAVDLSANRVVLELSGPRVRDLLASGCALDLHPRAFGPDRCAQTMLARAQVILERDGDAFRLFVRPSFARYLAGWLLDVLEGLAADEGL
jgi:sarcosine oxidase, subunit gamma